VTSHRLSTARARLVATLAEEIMRRDDTAPFAIESEHQLCRRFQISRVTVRLALGDLENRGLIYRKHGKGTFAHGQAKQNHRDIGFLIKNAHPHEDRAVAEMVRGAQAFTAPLRAAVVLLSREPEAWRPDLAGSLGGVIVVPEGVTDRDLQVLRERKVPFLFAAPSPLPGPKINFGQEEAARTMTERLLQLGHRRFALLSRADGSLDNAKRAGIHEALQAAGINPVQAPELRASADDEGVEPAMAKLLQLRPRPTALIAFDDSLAAMASFYLRRAEMRIPRDLSVAGFNDCPVLHYVEPALTTVGFEFFAGGRRAAEALHHATLTGIPVTDLFFEPVYRAGETVASPAAVEEKAA
jgi:GntR family transcriptional regulator of arabinose operon